MLFTDINECASRPCKNGAVCVDLVNDYRCDRCYKPYSGKNCHSKLSLKKNWGQLFKTLKAYVIVKTSTCYVNADYISKYTVIVC